MVVWPWGGGMMSWTIPILRPCTHPNPWCSEQCTAVHMHLRLAVFGLHYLKCPQIQQLIVYPPPTKMLIYSCLVVHASSSLSLQDAQWTHDLLCWLFAKLWRQLFRWTQVIWLVNCGIDHFNLYVQVQRDALISRGKTSLWSFSFMCCPACLFLLSIMSQNQAISENTYLNEDVYFQRGSMR